MCIIRITETETTARKPHYIKPAMAVLTKYTGTARLTNRLTAGPAGMVPVLNGDAKTGTGLKNRGIPNRYFNFI